MNGHNRSKDRFFRNHRVGKLQIVKSTPSGKRIKTVTLTDLMGWHKIDLPSPENQRFRNTSNTFDKGKRQYLVSQSWPWLTKDRNKLGIAKSHCILFGRFRGYRRPGNNQQAPRDHRYTIGWGFSDMEFRRPVPCLSVLLDPSNEEVWVIRYYILQEFIKKIPVALYVNPSNGLKKKVIVR